MPLKSIYLFAIILISIHSFGQTSSRQQLIDSATKYAGRFVNARPLPVQLDKKRIFLYNEWLYEQRKVRLPDSVYLQLIKNSVPGDTSRWTDSDMPRAILVQSRQQNIDPQKALTKFRQADSTFIDRLTWQIQHYNKTTPEKRPVYYYSRPVLDNSGRYAVVQYDFGQGMMNGGGGIMLFHLEQESWTELGIIVRWSY